jgi:DNA-binding MarR family transcriptional regulator
MTQKEISPSLKFFLSLTRTHALLARRFDGALGGLGFSWFLILFYLSQSKEEKMRRIDLAEKVGLTASGVTRILYPMEKIGLVKREVNEKDARVSHVLLSSAGKRQLIESLGDAEILAQEILPLQKIKNLEDISSLI